MTGAEALAYFTIQIGIAANAVGVTPPTVRPIYLHERMRGASEMTLAYVRPCPPGFECDPADVDVMWHVLWDGDKKRLRCIARHEVSHLALGHSHGALNNDQLALYERQVAYFQKFTWNEDSRCEMKGTRHGRSR